MTRDPRDPCLLPHLDRRLSPQGLHPLKSFLKFTLARSATALSYNVALITTSIKSNKSSFPPTPYIQRLVSLFPILIAVVPLYSACLLVCMSVCVFGCVLLGLLVFFWLSYLSIQLMELQEWLINLLTYLLTYLL